MQGWNLAYMHTERPFVDQRSVFTCCQAGYEPKHNACGPLKKNMALSRAMSLPPGGNAFWSDRARTEWELSQMRPEGLPPMESPQGGGVPIPSDDDLDEPQPVQGAGEDALRGPCGRSTVGAAPQISKCSACGKWSSMDGGAAQEKDAGSSEDFRTPPSGMTASELRGKGRSYGPS